MAGKFTSNLVINPGTPVPAGDGVLITCSVAGNVALKMVGGTTLTFPVDVGTSIFYDMSVIDVVAGGTTATTTVNNLYATVC